MSGQLVGEVIAASPQLRTSGLSRNGFLALIAIAEKCVVRTRQGSVKWDHLCDGLYGVSKSTAKRAVRELLQADLIRVAKPGWANQHGQSQAPIYELRIGSPMTPSNNRIGSLVVSSSELDETKSELDETKSELDETNDPHLTSDDTALDGSTDGSTDGDARASEPTDPPDSLPDWAMPPSKCPKHPSGWDHDEGCRKCQHLREWNTRQAKAHRQDANYCQAHAKWCQLMGQARAGRFGDWRPVKPPLNRSDFDPDLPWQQPVPPPALSVNGYDLW